MKKWMQEDWEFTVEVASGEAKRCRLGLEKGDVFVFQYGCPGGFCPRAMMEIHTWCEVVRCGGDFTFRGCPEQYVMDLPCPCHALILRLTARPIHRDGQGNYIGVNIPPD